LGIVHVVQLQLGIGIEQCSGRRERERHAAPRLVGAGAPLADRDQAGLRQPGDAERGAKVDQGAVGGAERDRRIAPARVGRDRPARDGLGAHLRQVLRRDRLVVPAADIDPAPQAARQQIDRDRERLETARQTKRREALFAQIAGGRAEHGRGGIEVGDKGGRALASHVMPPGRHPPGTAR
jgi:hypothetical protein